MSKKTNNRDLRTLETKDSRERAWTYFRASGALSVLNYRIIGLFRKRALYKRRYSAQETYNLIDPNDRVATP